MDFSVVMVTHGAWDWTRQALGALAAHTSEAHEVVVVDNASPDQTVERLAAEFPHIRLVRNSRNTGFGPASNQGVDLASTGIVVLLNTDALVQPGWARPLLAALEHEDVVGAAPMLLHLDGRLQEAGSLLARDGTVAVYGDGADVDDPAYRFPRQVDYASAACLALKRDEFLAVGGFDDRYAPAYYEDADLGMALAARGGHIRYEPASRVQHARYGSGSREAAAALSERNRHLFVERWADALRTRPASLQNPSRPLLLAARDAVAAPRVLIVEGIDPVSGSVATEILRRRPSARVTLLANDHAGADMWLSRGVEVAVPSTVDSWLADRPGFYDVVIAGDGADTGVLAGLQPQAALHVGLPEMSDIDMLLARAGV